MTFSEFSFTIMAADNGDDVNPKLQWVIDELGGLEKDIALADYDLRESLVLRFTSYLLIQCLVKEQVKRFHGLYDRRDELVSNIPNFWFRVV